MNELEEDKLWKEILKGYNESRIWKDFVEEKGGKIKWNKKGKSGEEWTIMTKEVFKKIGKNKGYKIRETNEKNKEFMALDQVWFNKENDEAVLALETENSAGFQAIVEDEFRKLLNFKSDYKILIWYNYDDKDEEDNLEKFQKKINGHPKVLKDEKFFIISLWNDEKVVGITKSILKKDKARKKTTHWNINNEREYEDDEEKHRS